MGPEELSYAVSFNKLTFDTDDRRTLRTVTFSDGLGRVVQSAREGVVYRDAQKRYGWNVSGAMAYDALDRVLVQQFPDGSRMHYSYSAGKDSRLVTRVVDTLGRAKATVPGVYGVWKEGMSMMFFFLLRPAATG